MKKTILTLMAIMTLFGCTSATISKNLAAGAIGCPPNDIVIQNETATLIGSMHNFEAVCKGKRFICSYQPTTGINCKEKIQTKEEQVEQALEEHASAGRFIANSDGTISDPITGLTWASKDSSSNINWSKAKSYCESYRGGGHTDWRMPTQDELAVLYDASKTYESRCGYDVHLTNLIHVSCTWVWASDTRGSDVAYYDFLYGYRGWTRPSIDRSYRALPVRSGR
jgi:hypothetical protein